MKCPKCGNENDDNAKFCKSCGEKLEKPAIAGDKNKKIIIALIAIVIILAGVVAYTSGILSPVELKTQEFDGFTLDVPVNSNFVLDESLSTPNGAFVEYWNKYENSFDLVYFMVGTNLTEDMIVDKGPVETDGDLKVFKNESDGQTIYEVLKSDGKVGIIVSGDNPDTLKRIANTFKNKDFEKVTKTSKTTAKTSDSSSKNSGSWVSIGSYSGSGSGSESITVPEGKIKVELSAYPIKNYATNHLYVTSSSGDSGGVDWGSNSAVETRSDSFTFTSKGSETLDIDYYETVSWEVEIYKYQ